MFDDLLKKATNLSDIVENFKNFNFDDLSIDKIKELLTDDFIQKYTKSNNLEELLTTNNLSFDVLENFDMKQLDTLIEKTTSMGSWKEFIEKAVSEKFGKN